ncbi:MAG: hypothetical protein VX764_06825 [Planctomycetota bacterium]|nr:hypothetical protein [Planctomycetota bacterium]
MNFVRCIFALVLCVALNGTVLHADDRPDHDCGRGDCMDIGRQIVAPSIVSQGPSPCTISLDIVLNLPDGLGTVTLSFPGCPTWVIYQPAYYRQVPNRGYCICDAKPMASHMVRPILQKYMCDYEWINECLPNGDSEWVTNLPSQWSYHEFICY